MADYTELKAAIRAAIFDNTEQAITGEVLQDILVDMVDALGVPEGGIPASELTQAVQQALEKALSAYQKPQGGIPASDIASGVIPDVSQFITKAVTDLVHYYTKEETYTQQQVNDLIGAISQFHYEIYASLGDIASPASNVLYLIGPTGSGSDQYEEYVYANGVFTKIGDTSIDLSGYLRYTPQTLTALEKAQARQNIGAAAEGALTQNDIADNLTTDDATKVLSAKQGKVLDGKISQLGQELIGVFANTFTFAATAGTYISSYVAYNFVNGHRYLIHIDYPSGAGVTTYFSVRDASGTALQNNIGGGVGTRDIEFVCNATGGVRWYCTVQQAHDSALSFNATITDLDVLSLGSLKQSIGLDIDYLDQVTDSVQPQFELGNISISGNGWIYSATTSRVRLKEGRVIRLHAGDTIGLTDYSNAVFYIGYRKIDGTYGYSSGWQSADYVAPAYGDYVILIRNSTETTQTSADALASLFKCKQSFMFPRNFVGGVSGISYPYIEYDTENQTITIPQDIVILDGDSYIVPNQTGAVTLNIGSAVSSALKIYYDKEAKTFGYVEYSNSTNYQSRLIIAAIRKRRSGYLDAGGIVSLYPWKIDGNPYGVKAEAVRGYTRGVNHRGYNGTYPENTLPAFKGSAKNKFKAVECDIYFTSDSVPVLLHDNTINRTARNADGTEISETIAIASITYAEALEYDFGIWKGAAFAGTKIPTLTQFIALCRNLGLHPYIELKVGTQAQIEACVDTVKQYGMLRDCTWISFNDALLGYVKGRDFKARLGYLASTISSTTITTAEALKNGDNEVFIDSSSYTAEAIALCKAANIPLEIWTVNNANTIQGLDAYISGVTSDSVDASRVLFDNSL